MNSVRNRTTVLSLAALVVFVPALALAADSTDKDVDVTVTVTAAAAGTDEKAKDEAVNQALRKAVEEACGVYIKGKSKTEDFQAVYDKVIAHTAGYVRESKVVKTWSDDEKTYATIKARVSTKKFEEDWAAIAHTIHQEGNPRVLFAINQTTGSATTSAAAVADEVGGVQGKLEDFFIEKGVQLVDHDNSVKVNKRDIMLASMKDDPAEVAALAAKFKADVVIIGTANAKPSRSVTVSGADMQQFTASLSIRVIRADSSQLLVSKTFGPIVSTQLQKDGGEQKVLLKLAEDSAPKLLAAVVEAWRKQANVSRNMSLSISGMDYDQWKLFKVEAEKLRGVQNLRLREITESVASIDIEYAYTVQNLADQLTELKAIKLAVTEFNSNRIKLKVIK